MVSPIHEETEKIINSAFKILEEYCIKSCNGSCCKEGALRLTTSKEKKLFNKKELILKDTKEVFLVSTDPKCIYLNESTNQCKIYCNRPMICKEYPIKLISGSPNIIMFHPSCKAISNGLLKDHIEELRNLGNMVMI